MIRDEYAVLAQKAQFTHPRHFSRLKHARGRRHREEKREKRDKFFELCCERIANKNRRNYYISNTLKEYAV